MKQLIAPLGDVAVVVGDFAKVVDGLPLKICVKSRSGSEQKEYMFTPTHHRGGHYFGRLSDGSFALLRLTGNAGQFYVEGTNGGGQQSEVIRDLAGTEVVGA